MKILQFLLLIIIPFAISAQEKIEGIIPCVDSMIESRQSNTDYKLLKTKITEKKIIFKSSNSRDTFRQDEILTWIEKIEKDSLRVYELINVEQRCYLLKSNIKQATGLASNFTSWLIVIPKSNLIFEFESLSENRELVYLNSKTGNLQFVRFTYGENFFWKRDWENVDFKIELNEIDNGEVKIVSSENSWCSEK